MFTGVFIYRFLVQFALVFLFCSTILAVDIDQPASVSVNAGANLFSDSFSTDPFIESKRWLDELTWGNASFTYNSDYNELDFYASGGGAMSLRTAQITPHIKPPYYVSVDFLSHAGLGGSSISLWTQRQTDDKHYFIKAYAGGGGTVDWYWGGGGIPNKNRGTYQGRLVNGAWYTMTVLVEETDRSINMTAVIKDTITGAVAVPPCEMSDTSPDRYKTNAGFGLELNVEKPLHKLFKTIDNFRVYRPSQTPPKRPQPLSNRFEPTIYRFHDAGVLEIRFDTSEPPLASITQVTCAIINKTTGDLVWSAKQQVVGHHAKFVFSGYGKLPSGDYTIDYSGRDNQGRVIIRKKKLITKSPPPVWLNNKLGREETVPPPWTPVKVVSLDAVEIWGRRYAFNPIGLPRSLKAAGAELLAAPVDLVTIIDGTPVSFIPDGPLTIRPGGVKTVIEANSTAGNLQLRVVTTVEFDGFARVDILLTGDADTELNKFWLEMPLTKDNALYHLPVQAGPTPIPDKGLTAPVIGIFDAKTYTTTDLYWVGGNERGLFWAAEDDRHWTSANRQKAQALIPEKDSVLWRLHFIDIARRMDKPLELTYCFMATPVKPVKNWYGSRVVNDACGYLREDGYWTRDTLQQRYDSGVRVTKHHETWTEWMSYPGTVMYEDKLKELIRLSREIGLRLCFYSNHVLSELAPECEEWGAEWSLKIPMVSFNSRQPPLTPQFQNLYRCAQGNSFADFYVYNWVRMIREYDMGGMYLDGTFYPETSTNPYYNNAYITDSGEVRPTKTIFAAREFMKRMYRACKAEDPNFYFFGHLADNYMMPSASFLDYTTGGENFVLVPKNYEFPWSYFRAVQTGRQFGIIKEFLTIPKFSKSYVIPLALVHGSGAMCFGGMEDIKAYKQPRWQLWEAFGIDQAEWVPYWKNSPLITSSHQDVKVSYHKKKGEVLLVVATNKHKKPQATIIIDLHKLGLDPLKLKVNAGLKDAIKCTPDPDGKLRLRFPDQTNYGGYVWLHSGKGVGK